MVIDKESEHGEPISNPSLFLLSMVKTVEQTEVSSFDGATDLEENALNLKFEVCSEELWWTGALYLYY